MITTTRSGSVVLGNFFRLETAGQMDHLAGVATPEKLLAICKRKFGRDFMTDWVFDGDPFAISAALWVCRVLLGKDVNALPDTVYLKELGDLLA